MRPIPALLAFCALSVSAAAQCDVDRLDPADPITYLGYTGALEGGLAAIADGGTGVHVFERRPSGWQPGTSFNCPGFFLFMTVTVTCSDQFVFAGAQEDANLAGQVYVYSRSNGYVAPQVITGSNPQGYDTFGAAMSVADDTLLVGASMMVMDVLCGPGLSYIFELQNGQWVETANFLPHGYTNSMTDYGVAVDTDGQTAVVGSSWDDATTSAAGAVYVYERVAGGWQETAKLFAANPTVNGRLGVDVAVDGDTILAGAATTSGGSVFVFERGGAGWVQTQVLTASDPRPGDAFGTSVELERGRAVVGAPYLGTSDTAAEVGAVYVFERGPSGWLETGRVVADDAEAGSRFGMEVSLDGNQVLWLGRGWFAEEARIVSLGIGSAENHCIQLPNSSGAPAVMSVEGCDSVLGNDFTLRASSVPAGSLGLFAFSQGGAQVPFFSGYRCLALPMHRLPVQRADPAGVLEHSVDFTAGTAALVTGGRTWHFQAYFRDPQAPAAFLSSDAIAVELEP